MGAILCEDEYKNNATSNYSFVHSGGTMDPRELLRALMARDGDNPNSLAAKVKGRVKQPQIHKFISGMAKEPRRATLQPLAEHYEIPLDAFYDSAVAEKVARRLRLDQPLTNVVQEPGNPLFAEGWAEFQPVRPDKFNFVPVVGQGAGGDLPERIWTDADYPVGATDEYAEVISTDPHAFIVRVVGFSMVPKYGPTDYALVEPGTDVEIEDDVLVRLANGQTMIKRLLSRRGHIRLGSYSDPAILSYETNELIWMYYVAYPVPARKIKSRA